ncbi:hypothetical protein Scep_014124 [Stephania cephalantha]|uniref:Uncharacterized protein n=1 Tax=Stephania cephalantha TaxID=152367 RepID=A0AAP0J0R1_9MAGN
MRKSHKLGENLGDGATLIPMRVEWLLLRVDNMFVCDVLQTLMWRLPDWRKAYGMTWESVETNRLHELPTLRYVGDVCMNCTRLHGVRSEQHWFGYAKRDFKSHGPTLLNELEGFPNLLRFLAVCTFDPRYIDFVADPAHISLSCPKLTLLHLADPTSLSPSRGDFDSDSFAGEDARISVVAIEEVFQRLT